MAHARSVHPPLIVAEWPGWKPTGVSITGSHGRPLVGAGGSELGKVAPHDGLVEKDSADGHVDQEKAPHV